MGQRRLGQRPHTDRDRDEVGGGDERHQLGAGLLVGGVGGPGAGRLEQVGLVDDAGFATAWVASRQAGRGLAPRALAEELRFWLCTAAQDLDHARSYAAAAPQSGEPAEAYLDRWLPLATGGSQSHMLALDYALRPVLSALGARHVLASIYATDAQVQWSEQDGLSIEPGIARRLQDGVDALSTGLLARREFSEPEAVPLD